MTRVVLGVAIAVASAAAAGCARGAPEPPPPAWQVRGPGGQQAIAVGTTAPELTDATTCVACHAAIVDEWRRSRHGQAWTNGIFQREYQQAPKPWCVNCHAPTDAQQRDLTAGDPRLADQGVGCAACHVRGGRLVAARRAATSPHDTVEDPTFGTPSFCADCHEFPFPRLDGAGRAVALTDHPMQTTVSSFTTGPYADAPAGCLTCHATRHGHGFPGAHDPGMLGAALAVRWCGSGDQLTVEVENAEAGHRVPTGDVHRHLLLRVWRSSTPAGLWEGFFGRRYEPADDGGKRTVWDSTIPPKVVRRFTLELAALADGELPLDRTEPINLALTYVFTADEFPRPGRAPSEPTATQLLAWRTAVDDLPTCPPLMPPAPGRADAAAPGPPATRRAPTPR
jgi:hypothetical protein